ncbi:MAG: right-handed parallel beta-helix repeat-containing protein, partial [Acidobacteriota bacterium]
MAHRFVVLVLLLVACNESSLPSDAGVDSGDACTDGRIGQCAAGLKPHGPACVPILDRCKDDEVPLLGGGCKRVGVEECVIDGAPGTKAPPAWQCTRVGPPTACSPGWSRLKDGWCEPVLPAAACAAGTMEVIGQSSCQPIGDCGSGTWGNLKVDASTVFVDAGYSGVSNGSMTQPYVAIGQALAEAKAGGRIAVAAGEYLEEVILKEGVILEGRCAQLVRLKGVSPTAPATVVIAGGLATLRGLTISGPSAGVRIDGTHAVLERVAVTECGAGGISVRAHGGLALRDSLVASNGMVGLWVVGSSAALERAVVRDTKSDPLGKGAGSGIEVAWQDGPAELSLKDSVVATNMTYGVSLWGATATIARSVVKDTQPAADKTEGRGILCTTQESQPSLLSLTDSLVAGNRMSGLQIHGSAATVERTVVRDTRPSASDSSWGFGVSVAAPNKLPTTLTLRESVLARNLDTGLVVTGATTLIVERSVVRDTTSSPADGTQGLGIYVGADPQSAATVTATIKDSLVAGNKNVGVLINNSTVTLERTIVRDTGAETSAGHWGMGVSGYPAQLTLRDCLVAGNRQTGVAIVLGGSQATLERTIIRDTGFQAMENGDLSFGVQTQLGATLAMSECIVARTRWVGVLALGSKATLSSCVVRDTEPRVTDGVLGIGVGVMADPPATSTLAVSGCAIERSRGVGIGVLDSSATVERTVVRGTLGSKDPDGKEGYGDGIYVLGARGSVAVANSLVESNL